MPLKCWMNKKVKKEGYLLFGIREYVKLEKNFRSKLYLSKNF